MQVAALQEAISSAPFVMATPQSAGMVKLLTCGSVDDGKSTLIGRLLWDAAGVTEDQRAAIALASHNRAVNGEKIDFSLLLDGLQAEREQGITIDIAWRYFETGDRRFVIIDSPGHEQYTRNMATGASHADIAILLVDARHGPKRQTRRHAAICDLVGIKKVILAVNKMDLVDYAESRYREIESEFAAVAGSFGFTEVATIPVAALTGDNVAYRSSRMPWYSGPTLLDYLETVDPKAVAADAPFRMPVQLVLRAAGDFRGYAGTVTSGRVRVGDRIVDARSGLGATLKRISTMDGDRPSAGTGEAVTLVLDTDLDISRGAVLSEVARRPVNADVIETRLVWLSEAPFDPESGYLLRTATDLTPVTSMSVSALVDFETLASSPAHACAMNDIADCRILLGRATALDLFRDLPLTGNFILVSAIDGATVAGGVITWAQSGAPEVGDNVLVLNRELLAKGLCADLGDSPADIAEFNRRAQEVATLLRSVGVPVLVEI
jgi:bifunctional enzyme CysN/CysC